MTGAGFTLMELTDADFSHRIEGCKLHSLRMRALQMDPIMVLHNGGAERLTCAPTQ